MASQSEENCFQTPKKFTRQENTPRKIITIPPSPFLEKLGYGTGVSVWKLNHPPAGNTIHSPWAIKNIRKNINAVQSDKYQMLLKNEANLLRTLNHENIIGFRGYMKSQDGRNCLAMEVGGESLGNMIETRCEEDLGPFPAKNILQVALSVAKALKYLHVEKKILHGDIKSFNIVIKDNFKEIKLCDFGVSLELTDKNISDKYVGTPIYSAPECQERNKGTVTEKADIFSFGLILWEMISLFPPHVEDLMEDESMCDSDFDVSLPDGDTSTLTEYDNEENFGTRPPLPDIELGPEYKPVIEIFYACTEQDPNKRPPASVLVDHLEMLLKNQK
ncbi:hypothetical protein RUM44_008523 [Polyplax serrata]|uniref:Protein kinase domain-containing protein n=1 Tax=Polyplax serrata TaxID=468196 RepID=A0ABR1BDD9_POLSC